MVFGDVGQEHLQFNEKTLWTGGPGNDPSYTGGIWTSPRPGALAEARRLVLQQGSQDPRVITDLLAQPREGYGSYQPFGDLYLDGRTPAEVSGYRRELDLAGGVARVRYAVGSTAFTREAFASYPDHAVVLRISADRAGSISFATRLTTPHERTALSVAGGRLRLAGHLSNGMALECQVQVRNEGGQRVDGADRVTVSGADAVTILLTAGTSYVHRYPDYTGADPHRAVTDTLDAAAHRSYRQLLARHQADYRGLFDRVRLDIGQGAPQVPTDRLLAGYTGGATPDDRALEALFFDYGRYLLISSSRAGSLPANLQGVWNKDREFLRHTGYPIMAEAARFWLDNLVTDPRDGALVAAPSYSPEHGPYTAGAALSQQIVRDLFTNVVAAGTVLGTDLAFRTTVRRALSRLDPGLRIGRWGQLQEWKDDLDDPLDTHRHVSQLFGLYPGDQISPTGTPAYAQAARVSLVAREANPDGPATPAGAAPGRPACGPGCCAATRRSRASGTSTCSTRCPTCGTPTRRSRSMATSAPPPGSPRCCCRATPAPSRCCPRCRGPGRRAASTGCGRAARSRSAPPGGPATRRGSGSAATTAGWYGCAARC
jgi:hypothetical protein